MPAANFGRSAEFRIKSAKADSMMGTNFNCFFQTCFIPDLRLPRCHTTRGFDASRLHIHSGLAKRALGPARQWLCESGVATVAGGKPCLRFHVPPSRPIISAAHIQPWAGRATSGTTALIRWPFSMLTRYLAAPIQIRKVPVIGTPYYQRRRNVSLQR
jgi:hypothetical protein